MGRVGRYKKIKAVDPFAKASTVAAAERVASSGRPKADMVPRARDVDRLPSKLAALMQQSDALRGKPKTAPKSSNTSSMLKDFVALPGETMRAFARRVNAERSKQLARIRSGEVPVAAPAPAAASATKPNPDDDGVTLFEAPAVPEDIDVLEHPETVDVMELVSSGGSAGPVDITSLISAGMKRRRTAGEDELHSAFAPAAAVGGKPSKKPREAAASSSSATGGSAVMQVAPDEFPVEVVAFGERAERPPAMKVAPRMSKRQKDAMALAAASATARAAADSAAVASERLASGKVKLKDAQGRPVRPGEKQLAAAERKAAAAERAAASAEQVERSAAVAAAQLEQTRTQTLAAYHALKRQKRADAKAAAADGGSARVPMPRGAIQAAPVR